MSGIIIHIRSARKGIITHTHQYLLVLKCVLERRNVMMHFLLILLCIIIFFSDPIVKESSPLNKVDNDLNDKESSPMDEVDNVSTFGNGPLSIESQHRQNGSTESNTSSVVTLESKEKDLHNGENSSSTEKGLDHSKEKNKDEVEKYKASELLTKNIEPSSMGLVNYLMSTDSKDSSDNGTALSRSDQVDLNESVVSVSEDNSSFVESNVSDTIPEIISSSGEEEQGHKGDDKSDDKVEEIDNKVELKEKEAEHEDKEENQKEVDVEPQEDKQECPQKDDSSEKSDSVQKVDDGDGKLQNYNKESDISSNKNGNLVENKPKEGQSSAETVGKVKDLDGSDILITINEDSDKEEDSQQKGISSAKPAPTAPRVTSTVKDDVVIVDLSDDKPLPPVLPKPIPAASIKPGTITIGPNGQHYVQHIIQCMDGRKQLIQVPVSSTPSTGYLKGPGMYTSLLNKAIANTVTQSQVSQKHKPQEEYIHPDDLIPQSSMELLALVKYECSQKKFDNTFWNGSCPVKPDISSMTKFLQDLGGDVVKQSAYSQIVDVQGRKAEQGKLGDKEKENLERMKKVVKELKEKYKHLELNYERCAGCKFVTESKNVMAFHKEHPHMEPPLDPYGALKCPHDGCDFKSPSGSPEAFAYHMEKEHSVKARIYDKPEPFKCHLCYFESKAKNNLTRHRFKCDKQFKLNQNQQPNYTDINFCLKNIMYKSQIAAKSRNNPVHPAPRQPGTPQMIRPKISITKPTTPVLIQQGPRNAQVPLMIPLSQAQFSQLTMSRSVRPGTQPVLVPMSQSMTPKPSPLPTVGQMLKQQQQAIVNRPVVPKPSAPSASTPQAGFEVCEICGGYVKDRMSLQIHFFYAHKVDLPAVLFQKNSPQFKCNVCQAPFWTAMGLTKHRQSSRHFDTVIQGAKPEIRCWICSQQPDNLYSHLQTFHKLNPNECMILKRCMFCAIQTRTRKDLELHMATTHGILIKNSPSATSTNSAQPSKPQGARNNFCVFCSKQFPDNTQLTLHCLRDHATCSGCGMVVARATDLAKHVCKSTGKKCSICGLKNLKQAFYNKHIRTHLKKCSVKVKRLTEKEIEIAMGKERKAEMDLAKQKELFTKLESDIWDEIQNRKKRDEESPTTKKRRSNESDKSVDSKKAKLEVGSDSENIVVLE